MQHPFTLCLVTHPDYDERYHQVILEAIRGGVTMVQFRYKDTPLATLKARATALQALLKPLNIPLIINDNVELAKEIDAAGVHLGQSDRSPVMARAELGASKIIGLSIETQEQLLLANQLTCIDYVAASAIFESSTKKDCKTQWGIQGLQHVVAKSIHPVMAIGGINVTNVQAVMNAGACGIAVVSAIYGANKPQYAAAELMSQIHHAAINLLLTRIKTTRPLILNLTNYVSMTFVANGLLCLGASPLMTQAAQEIEDLIKISAAVVINIGTLQDEFISLCLLACRVACEQGRPLILDPVGAGASHYRTQTCLTLLNSFKFAAIRGNASEIMALAGITAVANKGVDAVASTEDAITCAKWLSTHYQTLIVISGKVDAIVFQERVEFIDRGASLMAKVTGSGCLLTAVLAAFIAVEDDYYKACHKAVIFYALCGEWAAEKANFPGSFQVFFLDALSRMSGEM